MQQDWKALRDDAMADLFLELFSDELGILILLILLAVLLIVVVIRRGAARLSNPGPSPAA